MNWQYYILEQWKHTSYLEGIAVAFGVISVLFSYKNKIWLYPTGIISTAIYTYLLAQSTYMLYAEALLNAYYTIMSIYGWWHWLQGGSGSHASLPIAFCNKRELIISLSIGVVGWVVFYYLLLRFTDSDVAQFDAIVSSTACAGMWLLARRKVENWLWFAGSNLLAIPLLFYKKLPLTGCLTIFLLLVAVLGYRSWRQRFYQQRR